MASYASKQSTAIDYQRFESQRAAQQPSPMMEVLPAQEEGPRRRKAPARVPYGKYMLVAACVFAVLAVIVFSYMTVTELTVQNDRLRNEISTLRSRENILVAKKEQLYTLAFVEEYAKNNLGMVKLDKADIRYLELQNPERMTAGESGDEAAGSKAIGALARSFSAVLEYLN